MFNALLHNFYVKSHEMDLKTKVFNAASCGRLDELKSVLDHKPTTAVSDLVSTRTLKATPLVAACMNGHLDVAVYLVEKCYADIDQVGTVIFKKNKIESAPPLFCAAIAGHFNIVEMLVTHNASVNSITETNTTALRIACLYGRIEIVKYLIEHGADIEIANRNDFTCLMSACYIGHYEITKYLLECGADITRKSLKGGTALNACASSGNLSILKMLLQSGAKSHCVSHGITPLLAAAVNGHSEVVEYLIHEFNSTKQEKLNAFELLGCGFMRKENVDMAFKFWELAMQLRYEDSEFLFEKPITRSPIAHFVDSSEVRTLHQLQQLVSNPDEMRVQALLVVERILGPAAPDTFDYILRSGKTYFDNGNFYRCMQLWMYALDVQLKEPEPDHSMINDILFRSVELLSCIMQEKGLFEKCLPHLFRSVMHVYDRCLIKIEADLRVPINQKDKYYRSQFQNSLLISMHLIGLMCRLQPHLFKYEVRDLKKAVYELVHLNRTEMNGWTLLHLACCSNSSSLGSHFSVITFPSAEVIELVLEVGVCPDASENAPIHAAATSCCCYEHASGSRNF